MDKISETIRYPEYKPKEDAPDYIKDYFKEIQEAFKALIEDLEKRDGELSIRINHLLSHRLATEGHTSDYDLRAKESASVHSNLGAIGAITFSLPIAPMKGTHFRFAVQAAQELRIDPGASFAILDDSGQTNGKYKTANAIGETLHIVCNSDGDWEVIGKAGTWTEEV